MKKLKTLKEAWQKEGIACDANVTDIEIQAFELENGVHVPDDLKAYFKLLNGTGENYDGNFFQFNSLDNFKSLDIVFEDWEGIPNYKEIVNRMMNYNNNYIFANHNCYLFSYSIELSNLTSKENNIHIICGESYKKIADSFSEFLELYFEDSIKLQFG